MARAVGVAAAVVAVLVVAAATTWFFVVRDTTEPVGVDEAVTSFRTDTEPGAAGESPIPEGVYVYDTTGLEKTDAFLGEKHEYPARTTITVTGVDCGVSLLWRPVKGRSTRFVVCTASDGWQLRTQDERHTFYGRTETTTYRCEGTWLRPPAGTTEWDSSCSTGTAEEAGTGTLVGREPVRVGGRSVDAEHVRRQTTLSGDTRGVSTHDLWFDPKTGVPVKLVLVSRTANDSPIGEVHYDEDVTLVLTSLEPRR